MRIRSLATLALLGTLALSGCDSSTRDVMTSPQPVEPELDLAQGAALFARHCAICHGEDGQGNGPAADLVFPPVRDFADGRFRLASTQNGVPTQEDLIRTLERGMPGSAMPAWSWLPEEDLARLASHVQLLAREGLATRLRAGGLTRAEADEIAERRLTPGEPIAVGPEPVPNPGNIELGRRLYQQYCAACHGDYGTDEGEPRLDDQGIFHWTRDFTDGFLKGGASHEDLVHRIVAGMPGTPMPGTRLEKPGYPEALAAYVAGLIPDDSEQRYRHRREHLRTRRVEALPESAIDRGWQQAEEIEVVLAPLRWRDDAIFGVRLAALHDGEHIAIRLRWHDATADDRITDESARGDGAALQFSDSATPPLFGMGSEVHPVNIWHWKAFRMSETAGALDVLIDGSAHVLVDSMSGQASVPDLPPVLEAPGVTRTSTDTESLRAEGFEAVLETDAVGAVRALADWRGGEWELVFTRPLTAPGADAISLVPGSEVQVACAIWNGSAGDHRGRKSISIWQSLSIDP